MKLIVCLSDDNGMMFNHRRQSRDRVLIADMIQHVQNAPLWVSPYSAPLFGEDCPRHLNGIFAFAVYDPRKAQVFFARDRLGVKPFFLCPLRH